MNPVSAFVRISFLIILISFANCVNANTKGCRGGDSRQAPWISLTVNLTQNWYLLNNSGNFVAFTRKLENEQVFKDNKTKSTEQACEQNFQGSQKNVSILGSFECWSKRQADLRIRWKKQGEKQWTQAVQTQYYGWNPWKSSYGIICKLTNSLESLSLTNLEVGCYDNNENKPKLPSPQYLRLSLEWFQDKQIISAWYSNNDGKKNLGFSKTTLETFTATYEEDVHTITLTQCVAGKNQQKNPQLFETPQLEEKAKDCNALKYQTIFLLVVMAVITGVNIAALALRWKINRDLVQDRIATISLPFLAPPPPPTIPAPPQPIRANPEILI